MESGYKWWRTCWRRVQSSLIFISGNQFWRKYSAFFLNVSRKCEGIEQNVSPSQERSTLWKVRVATLQQSNATASNASKHVCRLPWPAWPPSLLVEINESDTSSHSPRCFICPSFLARGEKRGGTGGEREKRGGRTAQSVIKETVIRMRTSREEEAHCRCHQRRLVLACSSVVSGLLFYSSSLNICLISLNICLA